MQQPRPPVAPTPTPSLFPAGIPAPFSADARALLRESMQRISPKFESLLGVFYLSMAERHTELKPVLLQADGTPQTLTRWHMGQQVFARCIEEPESCGRLLQEVGWRHATSAGKPEYWHSFLELFPAAIATAEGPAWTPALSAAWSDLVQRMVAPMLAAVTAAQAATR